MTNNKKDIRALSKEELKDFFIEQGDKAFRSQQVYEWLWKKSLKTLLERNHDPSHGRFGRLLGAQFKDVSPFGQIGIDDEFRFAGVGQYGAGSLGSGSIQEIQVDHFGYTHGLVPEFVIFAVFIKKQRFDKGDLSIELIIRIPAVALTFLEKGARTMADYLMGNRPVNNEFYCNMPMFCL